MGVGTRSPCGYTDIHTHRHACTHTPTTGATQSQEPVKTVVRTSPPDIVAGNDCRMVLPGQQSVVWSNVYMLVVGLCVLTVCRYLKKRFYDV